MSLAAEADDSDDETDSSNPIVKAVQMVLKAEVPLTYIFLDEANAYFNKGIFNRRESPIIRRLV